ncbi:hemolysin secretion protein D [Hyphomicrobium nitrativorans NL23]|uniref:Hemolysin secretion protein D n=1 Tax=Hyphomicrobium nitrativorans NL23 TaxID=1029756 RepID=V5SEF2_9HYPH|nr:efflux RND transporter periplasmic adaptor subunit [Hyphomicrobium nitrativorans]AHB48319.1 hemolysin secretion protein D [Hyphomicrobium nitrativorans NL23]
MSPRRSSIAFVALIAVATSLGACREQEPGANAGAAPPAPTVTVAKPVTKLVADHDEYVGRFVALDFVEVRARVSGYLSKIHFTDGQLVEAGASLFTVDPRPFEAALEQAKASVVTAEANLAFAESDLSRAESLVSGTSITQQTIDQRVQAKRVAEASVTAQKAALAQAELDLEFTELRAPISGRIGDRRVSLGNLVTGGTGGNTTLLATVASVDPIRFEFTMDEASYLRYLRAVQAENSSAANRGMTLPARLKLIDDNDFVHEGSIDFVDNTIDRSSGTIRGRAEFNNADGRLTPGMFGRIRVATSKPAEALLVPDGAIGTEQVRKFVYVVSADNVVNPKYVTLGPVVDGLRVITSGLEAGDDVVVNGLMRIRPGVTVTPEQAQTANGAAGETVVGTN